MNKIWGKIKKFVWRKKIIIPAIIALIIGGLIWNGQRAAKQASVPKTTQVTRGEVKEIVAISGKITADKQATLNFQTNGKLAYVRVKEGDRVVAGQALMGLDNGDSDYVVNTAYNKYLAADANAKEVEDEVKNHDKDEDFAMRNTRVAAQTARDMAYDAWLQAKRDQAKAHLVAPFDGFVSSMTVNSVGDTVGVTDGITIVAPGGLHFEGEVDETDISKIQIGQNVEIKLDAFEGKTFKGTISRIGFVSGLSSTGATVYPVEISMGETDQFRVGMNGDANIVIATAENTLKLPIEAVNDNKVTVPGEKETTKNVVTGLQGDTEVEIKEGLNEGDTVVIK